MIILFFQLKSFFFSNGNRECIDTQVYPDMIFDYTDRYEQVGEYVIDTDYQCRLAVGTDACALNVYTTNNLEICEGLYCVDPNNQDSCLSAGLIPPHGMFAVYCRLPTPLARGVTLMFAI